MKWTILLMCFTYCFFTNAQVQKFQWAKNTGGDSSLSAGYSIITDAMGNVYTLGYFSGTIDVDPGVGIFNLKSINGTNLFILKLDANGNFAWAKSIAKNIINYNAAITTDRAGNVLLTNYFNGTVDIDPGPAVHQLFTTRADVYILKLDPSGNFAWARQMGGGMGSAITCSIATDAPGNIYTTGSFSDTVDFDPGTGKFNLTTHFMGNIFISKLNSSGNFVWAKKVDGPNSFSEGKAITVDATGCVSLTGKFNGIIDFNPGPDTFELNGKFYGDMFILKLNESGQFLWAVNMEGGAQFNNDIEGRGIAVDSDGNVYTTGIFNKSIDFDPGSDNFTLSGGNIFFLKLDMWGNFIWARRIHNGLYGNSDEMGRSIALDAAGNIYTTGSFQNTVDIDPGKGIVEMTSMDEYDVFILKLNEVGDFVWVKQMGGHLTEEGLSIALDASNNIYTTGYFSGTVDFNPDAPISNVICNGTFNAFVQKLGKTSSGITEDNSIGNFLIYPNPTNGIFNIDFPADENVVYIRILNSLGTLVYESKNTFDTVSIDLSAYASGLYVMEIIGDNHTVLNQKIIRQ